jgi:hypothetical protein
VFESLSPNLARALLLASEDFYFWSLTGARGVSILLAVVEFFRSCHFYLGYVCEFVLSSCGFVRALTPFFSS